MYLPPDKDSLHHHFMRVNYITYCQKHFKLRDHPSPLGNGLALDINGKCRPVRYSCPALCPHLNIDIESEAENTLSENSESEYEKTEYEESSDSDLSGED